MQTRILSLFTRTPLHVGAGSSVGAIDQPIIRERHTRFPVIPGSSLKGVLASLWDDELVQATDENGKPKTNKDGKPVMIRTGDTRFLFGSDESDKASAGALLVGEAKLLAFPVRSAKGCFAWLTCPLALSRLARDHEASKLSAEIPKLQFPSAEAAILPAKTHLLSEGGKVVFEEYALPAQTANLDAILAALAGLCPDELWKALPQKLAIVSDELFAHFAEQACEVAQHIRIDDASGTVANGALFNQENVPSEALFYSVVSAQSGKGAARDRKPQEALSAVDARLQSVSNLLQLGADETTGLGWCSAHLAG